jgi:hypothetical protein
LLAKTLDKTFKKLEILTPASAAAVRGAVFAALAFRKIRDAYGSPLEAIVM